MVVPAYHSHGTMVASNETRDALSAREQDENEWVDFDSASFQANKKKKKKKRSKTKPTTEEVARADSPSVTPSWMQRPVNSDASWMPIAPPTRATSSAIIDSRDDVRDDREVVLSPVHRRRGMPEQGLQNDREAVLTPPQRGRSIREHDLQAGDREAVLSAHQQHRSGIQEQQQAITSPVSVSRKTLGVGRPPRRSSVNNATSSDSSSSDVKRKSRGRAVAKSTSHRARSNSQSSRRSAASAPVLVEPEKASRPSRGRNRSNSDGKTPGRRARSTSRTRAPGSPQPASKRGRSSAKPPTTSGRPGTKHSIGRGRSTSLVPGTREQSSSQNLSQRQSEASRQRIMPSSSSSVGPGLPRPPPTRLPTTSSRAVSDDASFRTSRTSRTMDANIGREVRFGTTAPVSAPVTAALPSPRSSRKEGGLMEKLFGDQVDGEVARRVYKTPTARSFLTGLPENIHSRILLSATVYHNTATNLWITTVNTNQKGVPTNPSAASKFLKAFSFATEKEARESAIANAPPKMLPFGDNETCFICQGKFAVFRRPSHCRNCGVCICSSCTTSWPSKAIPETYNLKSEKSVKVCMSCDAISQAFKKALMKGDYQEVTALYGTGNVNLRTPFNMPKSENNKGEAMYPIHSAVEGGNLSIVRWLVEERYCPIKRVCTGNGKKKRGTDIPIKTSKGRSALTIALTNQKVQILRYLVVEKGVSVHEVKDLTLSLRALEATLTALPHTNVPLEAHEMVTRWAGDGDHCHDGFASDISGSFLDSSPYCDNGDESTIESRHSQNTDICIICYDNSIDCVMTPCGHQICCLECAHNMSNCPVCNSSCEFIRIFKP